MQERGKSLGLQPSAISDRRVMSGLGQELAQITHRACTWILWLLFPACLVTDYIQVTGKLEAGQRWLHLRQGSFQHRLFYHFHSYVPSSCCCLFTRLQKPLEANGEHADYPSPPACSERFRKHWVLFLLAPLLMLICRLQWALRMDLQAFPYQVAPSFLMPRQLVLTHCAFLQTRNTQTSYSWNHWSADLCTAGWSRLYCPPMN